jgi:hypothetical protein
MHITDRQAQSLLQALYHTAAKDHNDVIANAASRLAVQFESATGKGFTLADIEQRLIRYAIQMKPKQLTAEQPRRKTYKRRVSVA